LEDDKLRNILKFIKTKNPQKIQIFKKTGLIWRIETNEIENSYLSWIGIAPQGIYWVTWPWRKVKFIPLLTIEYLNLNSEGKIAIICETNDNSSDLIKSPDIFESFKYLIMRTDGGDNLDSNEIIREIRGFNKNCILEKQEFVKYTIKTSDCVKTGVYDGNINECESFIKKEYGKRRIKSIERHPPPRYIHNPEIISPKGNVEVNLHQQSQYFCDSTYVQDKNISSRDIHYRSEWFWDYLINTEYYKKILDFVHLKKITPDFKPPIKEDKCNVYILSNKMSVEEIHKALLDISPNILIIEDSDKYFRERWFRDGLEKYNNFLSLIKSLKHTSIFMFSSDPEARHCYDIEHIGKNLNLEIIPHTWDTPKILNHFPENKESDRYHSPYSSGKIGCREFKKNNIAFLEVKDLEKITSFENECSSILNAPIKQSVINFLKRAKRSPLNIIGSPQEITNIRQEGMNYDLMINYLHTYSAPEQFIKLKNELDSVYKDEYSNPRNPLRNEIEELTKKILSNKENKVYIVVHPWDIIGLKKLFQNFNELDDRLNIVSWKKLMNILDGLDGHYKHNVISVLSPNLDFKFSEFNPNLLYFFVGEKENIASFGRTIKRRTEESWIFPIHRIKKIDFSPPSLLKLLDSIPEKTLISTELIDSPQILDPIDEIEFRIEELHKAEGVVAEKEKSNADFSFVKNSKFILGDAGWSSKDTKKTRRIALLIALKQHGKTAVLNALKWQYNRWKTQSEEVSDICEEDIDWINHNWEMGKNIKKKFTERGIIPID